ncbi:MAG TPA: serine/threonine-protein kinase [Thermoguttaceae bacterium]|nr:serine/threonine-protein kinase [Thermoguttaceae bacterium]
MAFLDRLKSLLSGGKMDVSKRFALLREAISGTMSKFYMARDLRTGQIVGLKILDAKKTAAIEARYQGMDKPSEGEISLFFDHPRIVKAFEHGITTKGEPYLVMEFLGGPGMNSLIVGRDALLDGRRMRFITQAAEGLAAVHAAGLIHRDVCPRNYILTEDRESLKLTDFGLTVPATPPFMQPGKRTGTPNYMAPEVVRRRPTDQRLDIFAFGVTIYEMCTFELPWLSGATGMAAMSHDTPPTDIRQYSPKLHPRLAKAIHACLEPNVERRCPSIQRFLQFIRGVQDVDGE